MVDFSTYQFRASQCGKLLTGTFGLTDVEKNKLEEYEVRKKTYLQLTDNQQEVYDNLVSLGELTIGQQKKLDELNKKKNTLVGLTEKMQEDYDSLIEKQKTPLIDQLSKTVVTELRKIHRAETFGRNFLFTNKYVQKGILQEEEAITTYMKYRAEILKVKSFFSKNEQRLRNKYFSGEWDLPTINQIKESGEGFDIKTSWSLDTFPFSGDELNIDYKAQNHAYMDLTGAKRWTTAYVLVNGTEYLVFNEKQKHYYALNQPDEEDRLYDEYIRKCRDVEKMMIFDYDRFVEVNPYHVMEHSRDEWYDNNYDIPLKYRVVEFTTDRDEEFLEDLKLRVEVGREYLNSLNNVG